MTYCLTLFFWTFLLFPFIKITAFRKLILFRSLNRTNMRLRVEISCIYGPIFLIGIVGSGVQSGPLGTAATNRPIVPAPGDYDDGEIGGMIGRRNRSTRRKPAPMPLCPPQIPHAARTRSRSAAVGSQRLTALATARPLSMVTFCSSEDGNRTSLRNVN
jgi:hypothetical protein